MLLHRTLILQIMVVEYHYYPYLLLYATRHWSIYLVIKGYYVFYFQIVLWLLGVSVWRGDLHFPMHRLTLRVIICLILVYLMLCIWQALFLAHFRSHLVIEQTGSSLHCVWYLR